MSSPRDDKFSNMRKSRKEGGEVKTPRSGFNRNSSQEQNEDAFRSNKFKVDAIDNNDMNGGNSRQKRLDGGGSLDDNAQIKPRMKKNPNFDAGAQQQPATVSSDDDIPLGFSRRKRLSSTSSFQKKFESNAQNIVQVARDPSRKDTYYDPNIEEINRDIQKSQSKEQERMHYQSELLKEQENDEIYQKFREHEEAIRVEIDKQSQAASTYKPFGYQNKTEGLNIQQPKNQFLHFNQANDLLNQQQQRNSHVLTQNQPYSNTVGHNYFPPQSIPSLPQYTNLDIPGNLDQSLKQMQDTLQKLKTENQSLKNDLNSKQILNATLQNNEGGKSYDQEQYEQYAQNNLKLRQQVEDMRRKDAELKNRLSSLQANKQYTTGRTVTLTMDVSAQDKQEEHVQRQIIDFNGLIRDKESYIKQLMNELNQIKESKDQLNSELQVLNHKEEFITNELSFKEDQLNEIFMINDDMRRKISSGQSQSKYLLIENERLKKELNTYREESAVLKASSDFLQNELMGLHEHLTEYEHKLVMSQTAIDQLQRQNQQGKSELAHNNMTIQNQQKTYEELKNQLQIINERNQRISMQNEMMMSKQQYNQEQLLLQMSSAQRMMPKEEFGGQTSQFEEREHYIEQVPVQHLQKEIQEQRSYPQKRNQIEQIPQNPINLRRDESPYQDIQKKNKGGNSMSDAFNWPTDDENTQQNRPSLRQNKQQQQYQGISQIQQNQSKAEAMSGILNWVDDNGNQNQKPNRQVQQQRQNLEQIQGDRSRSAKRKDQNDLLHWDDEEEAQAKRVKQRDDVQYQPIVRDRSISLDRKRKEGQSMQNALAWNDKESPFRDRQMIKDAEEVMKWKQQSKQPMVDDVQYSPNGEVRHNKKLHQSSQVAGLLTFQEQNNISQQVSSPSSRRQSFNEGKTASASKYGAISIQLGGQQNQQEQKPQYTATLNTNSIKQEEQSYNTPNREQRTSKIQTQNSAQKNSTQKQVAIDLGKNNKNSGLSTPSENKVYGAISEQLFQKMQDRRDNLDKFLLQMQIEKDKLTVELNRIGDHPKTTQQYRRKEEITSELLNLNNNMASTKNKLKQMKQ